MRRHLLALSLLTLTALAPARTPAQSHDTPGILTVKPRPYTGPLTNPGIGFTTFQRFNGDSLNAGTKWTEGFPIDYQPFHGSLQVPHFPLTTIAYFRIYWRYVEPQQGTYNWDLLDHALRTAHERHQTLMLRIAPYGSEENTDVPAWYRALTHETLRRAPSTSTTHSDWYRPLPDAHPDWQPYSSQWMVDPTNPAYAHFFGDMIRALGQRYDGDPDLELVDISIVGPWGEGSGTPLLPRDTMHALMSSYLDAFKKTPLVVQPTDPVTVGYALSRAHVGWRADCLGDMGGFNPHWNHMEDFYPEAVVEDGLQDAWKTAPVTMEACWVMQHWKDQGWDTRYIIDQAIQWHVSSFNAKSSAVPPSLQAEVDRWLLHMGYRFALRRFTYPETINASRKLAFTSWWENQGNSPAYRPWPLAIRLSNASNTAVMLTGADIRQWLPGDNLYNNDVFIPATLPDGDYTLSIALVDPQSRQPKIKLAIQGIDKDGWYPLGKITVHQTLTSASK